MDLYCRMSKKTCLYPAATPKIMPRRRGQRRDGPPEGRRNGLVNSWRLLSKNDWKSKIQTVKESGLETIKHDLLVLFKM